MKILLLTQWYYPEPGPHVHELAEELVSRGHGVTVLTGFPTYPSDRFYEGYRPRLFLREECGGVKIVRVPHFAHGKGSAVLRVLNYCSFMFSAMTIGNALIGKADCMYVFLPPPLLGLAAKVISFFHRISLMYDIQDIWPDAIEASSFSCSKVFKRAISLIASFVYPFAKAISVPSAGYRRNLISKGVEGDRIEVIPNWADEHIFRPLPYDATMARQYGLEGAFTVVFAGNLGHAQSLETILDAAELLRDKPDIRFLLAGDGAALESLRVRCGRSGLTNVIFAGRLPVEDMPLLFSVADLLVVHLREHRAFRMTIPRKTQEYMACGKPILMGVGGDAAELINETRAGVTCRPELPAEMAEAILQVYQLSPEQRRVIGNNARKAYERLFQKRDVVGQYERLLYRVAGIEACRRSEVSQCGEL
ncbi:MAG: glycosyltransferase family 4 protein [bacterium]